MLSLNVLLSDRFTVNKRRRVTSDLSSKFRFSSADIRTSPLLITEYDNNASNTRLDEKTVHFRPVNTDDYRIFKIFLTKNVIRKNERPQKGGSDPSPPFAAYASSGDILRVMSFRPGGRRRARVYRSYTM